MDESQLRAFVTASRRGSFSAAAEGLHLTQPAVSKRIATLEQALNTRLFDRIGRQIILTEAGNRLLPKAEQLLAAFADLRHGVDNLREDVSGRLSLGTSHHVGLHRLPPVLRRYAATFPEVTLDLRFVDSEEGCRGVERGELEMAVVTLPDKVPGALEAREIWADPLAVVVGPSHPLAGRRQLTLDELLDHVAILPGHGTFTRSLIEQAIGAHVERLRVALSTNYLETNKMMTAIGLGWSILPQSMVDNELSRITLLGVHLSRSLGYVTRRGRTLSNATRAMIELLVGSKTRER